MLDSSACRRTAAGSSQQGSQGLAARLKPAGSWGVQCGAYSRQQQLVCVMLQARGLQAVIAGTPAAPGGRHSRAHCSTCKRLRAVPYELTKDLSPGKEDLLYRMVLCSSGRSMLPKVAC